MIDRVARCRAFLLEMMEAPNDEAADDILRRYAGKIGSEIRDVLKPLLEPARVAGDEKEIAQRFNIVNVVTNWLHGGSGPDSAQWNEVVLMAGEYAIQALPSLPGSKDNIELLMRLAGIYLKRPAGEGGSNLRSALVCTKRAKELLTDDIDGALTSKVWVAFAYCLNDMRAAVGNPPASDEEIEAWERSAELTSDVEQRAFTLSMIGSALEARATFAFGSEEDLQRARKTYEDALSLLHRERNREAYATLQHDLAKFYLSNSSSFPDDVVQIARQHLEDLIELYRDAPPEKRVELLNLMSRVHADLPPESGRDFRRAIELRKESLELAGEAGEKDAHSFTAIGYWYEIGLNELEEALPWYERAYRLTEERRQNALKPSPNVAGLKWTQDSRHTYPGLVRAYMSQGLVNDAVRVAMNSRCRFGNELLANFHSDLLNRLPRKLSERLEDTRRRFARTQTGFGEALEEQGSIAHGVLREESEGAVADYRELLGKIDNFSPSLSRLLRGVAPETSAVSDALRPDEAYIILYPVHNQTFAFVIRHDVILKAFPVASWGRSQWLDHFLKDWVQPYDAYRAGGSLRELAACSLLKTRS